MVSSDPPRCKSTTSSALTMTTMTALSLSRVTRREEVTKNRRYNSQTSPSAANIVILFIKNSLSWRSLPPPCDRYWQRHTRFFFFGDTRQEDIVFGRGGGWSYDDGWWRFGKRGDQKRMIIWYRAPRRVVLWEEGWHSIFFGDTTWRLLLGGGGCLFSEGACFLLFFLVYLYKRTI